MTTPEICAEMASRIERWAIERLIPYERNARTHSPQQIRKIADSIREFGFNNPILVDAAAGIIAGHARLEAARELNLTEVPVIVLSHLSEAHKRAYILADNRLALEAGWDDEILRQELQALENASFELDLIGFSREELDELLGDKPSADRDDEAPAVETTAITQPGDIWLLGPHRILCGDAVDASHLDALMAGDAAEMVFTDPPYSVAYCPAARRGAAAHRPIANDNLEAGFAPFLRKACANLLHVTRGGVYICMSSSQLHTLHAAFTDAGGHWSTFLIWSKDTFTLGRSDYQRQYEPMLYGWKAGATRYWCGDRSQGDVWCFDKPRVNDLHPTMKPVELIERAIQNSSRSGDIVLDVFGGSGSTLIACHKGKRRARLMELDPLYVDVSVRRWQDYTGQNATRASDGRTFNEILTATPAAEEQP